MALRPVSDPQLLQQLNGGGLRPVEDPEVLAQLNAQPAVPQASTGQAIGRGLGLTGRALFEGVKALPEMAQDFGVGLRNLSEGAVNKFAPGLAQGIYAANRSIADAMPQGLAQDLTAAVLPQGQGPAYQPASTMNREALNAAGVPEPQGFGEKALSLGLSGLAGSLVPAPQAAAQAPKSFVPPAKSPVQEVFREAQDAGYVAPPTTVNPTMANRIAEGAAGKASVAQLASMRNQNVTNAMARKALGISDDTPLTIDTLKGIREKAGAVYKEVGDSGEILPDSQFLDELAQLGKSSDDILKDFPDANVGAGEEIGQLVNSLLRDKFDAKSALQYLKELRSQASGNLSYQASADPAKRALGMAQKEAASTLEDMIGRHLAKGGKPELAGAFDQARQTIAKTYSVQSALNESTGNVVAGGLGSQLKKGKPLSGELELAARFARAFPKATKEVTESFPGVSPWDFGFSGLGSLAIGSGAPLAYPFIRMGLREGLLRSPAQKAAAGRGLGQAISPRAVMGSVPVVAQ
jgi:hypothetical protein